LRGSAPARRLWVSAGVRGGTAISGPIPAVVRGVFAFGRSFRAAF
jgi:hypothetical protein